MGGSHPLFQPSAKNALLFFVWLWYIGLEIVKAALKSSIFLFFLEQLCYFNLSPQGDGNGTNAVTFQTGQHFNLSPQGDGNGTQTESLMIDLIFQLIPARGRKPLLHPVRAAGLNNFNLSPQNPLRRCAPALPKGELFQLPLPCTKLPLSGELARRKP